MGDLREGHALIRGVLRRSEPRGANILKAHKEGDVLKVRAGLHALPDGGTLSLVPEPGGEGFQASGVALRRQDVDQLGGARRIGVDIAGDVQPLRPGVREGAQHPGHRAPPVPAADGLQVADLHRGLQRPGHRQHLREGGLHAVPLLTHVDGDHDAASPQGGQEGDELLRGFIALRRVAKAQGDAQSSVRERPLQGGPDGGGFLRRERAGAEARDARPEGAHADELPGVEGQGAFAAAAEVVPEAGEGLLSGVPGDGGEIAPHLLPEGPVQRRGGEAAVAVDDGGEALAELPVPETAPQQGQVRVAVDVQKARRQAAAPGIDNLPGPGLPEVAQGGDPSFPQSHVRPEGWLPAAVDHLGVHDFAIQHGCAPFRRQGCPAAQNVSFLILAPGGRFCNGRREFPRRLRLTG